MFSSFAYVFPSGFPFPPYYSWESNECNPALVHEGVSKQEKTDDNGERKNRENKRDKVTGEDG
jgi:hypothetical protein